MIGDTVNTAVRVEAAARETGDEILIADATRRLLEPDGLALEPRPPVTLTGKRTPVALWAPRVILPVPE